MEHMTQGEADPFEAGRALVASQCDYCAYCSARDIAWDDEIFLKYEVPMDGFLSRQRTSSAVTGALSVASGIVLAVSLFTVAARRRLRRQPAADLDGAALIQEEPLVE